MGASDVLQVQLDGMAPEQQAFRHLRAVLPVPPIAHEAIEVRCLDTRKQPASTGPRLFLPSIESVVEAAMQHRSRWDVFFGVGTRACPVASSMADCVCPERGSDHLSRLQVVWGDFDTKGKTLDELLQLLSSLALTPSVIVGSGKGLHAYWRLDQPTSEALRVEAVNKSLRLRFGADNAVDAARILRVAGTFNYKYGDPLPVTLLSDSDV